MVVLVCNLPIVCILQFRSLLAYIVIVSCMKLIKTRFVYFSLYISEVAKQGFFVSIYQWVWFSSPCKNWRTTDQKLV